MRDSACNIRDYAYAIRMVMEERARVAIQATAGWLANRKLVAFACGAIVFVAVPQAVRPFVGSAAAQSQQALPPGSTDVHVKGDPNSTSPTVGVEADGMSIDPNSRDHTRVIVEGGGGSTTGLLLHGPLIIGAPLK
jgi:hypothetical protein